MGSGARGGRREAHLEVQGEEVKKSQGSHNSSRPEAVLGMFLGQMVEDLQSLFWGHRRVRGGQRSSNRTETGGKGGRKALK